MPVMRYMPPGIQRAWLDDAEPSVRISHDEVIWFVHTEDGQMAIVTVSLKGVAELGARAIANKSGKASQGYMDAKRQRR